MTQGAFDEPPSDPPRPKYTSSILGPNASTVKKQAQYKYTPSILEPNASTLQVYSSYKYTASIRKPYLHNHLGKLPLDVVTPKGDMQATVTPPSGPKALQGHFRDIPGALQGHSTGS